MIILTADDLQEGVPATAEALHALIPALAGREDPFAILSRGAEDMTYMQALWTPAGYLVEYQEGSLGRHFRTVREDLSAEDVIAAFQSYAAGESGWRTLFEYRRVKLGGRWYHFGYDLGRAWGNFRTGIAESLAAARQRK